MGVPESRRYADAGFGATRGEAALPNHPQQLF